MSEKEEKYILKNTTTNLYLKGYKGNKPLWVEKEEEAAVYNEMDALRVQRQTENLYSPAHKIVLLEKGDMKA